MNIVNFVKFHSIPKEDTTTLSVLTFTDNSTANVVDLNSNGTITPNEVTTALTTAGKSASDVKKISMTKNTTSTSGDIWNSNAGFTNVTEGIDFTGAVNYNVYANSICNGWTNSTQDTFVVGSNVTTVDYYAFRNWSSMVNGIDFSSATSLTSIKSYAFDNWSSANNSGNNLIFPTNVNEVLHSAFEDWSSWTGGIDFSNNTALTVIDNFSVFRRWTSANPAQAIIPPVNLTKLGWDSRTQGFAYNYGVFEGWTSAQNGVDLSSLSSLAHIGGYTFSNWESANMSNLVIPAAVTSIDVGAFMNWKSMTGTLQFLSVTPPTMIESGTNIYHQFIGWDALPLGIEVTVPPTANLSTWKAALGVNPNVGRFRSINGVAWDLIP